MGEREFYEQLVVRISDLERRLAKLEAGEAYRLSQSLDNVSNPPTAVQAAAAFAAPATVGDGFPALIDDDDLGARGWALFVVNGAYWHVSLTKCL